MEREEEFAVQNQLESTFYLFIFFSVSFSTSLGKGFFFFFLGTFLGQNEGLWGIINY